ncbi:MAG TPA: helix-turn-helix domain-containing protein, partial [Cellvibrionaceae bacterium]|nr:helix-turn-helix domain-containing protein [Cellvibrionaceae bacterium]
AVIGVDDLPDFVRAAGPPPALQPGMTLAEAEKLLIQQTLAQVTANRADAARALGISRRALQYKLKHYGLLPPRRPAAAPAVARAGR